MQHFFTYTFFVFLFPTPNQIFIKNPVKHINKYLWPNFFFNLNAKPHFLK